MNSMKNKKSKFNALYFLFNYKKKRIPIILLGRKKFYFEKYFILGHFKVNLNNNPKRKKKKKYENTVKSLMISKKMSIVNIIDFRKKENLPFGIFSHFEKLTDAWDIKNRWEWLVEEEEIVWGDLELSPDCLTVSYRAFGGSDEDSAAIKGNFKVCGKNPLNYFEVEILNTGREGFIGVGMTHICCDLDRLPGWEMYSFGYHGDDGHFFDCCGTGKIYGPKFSKGDTIGVCWNLIEKTVFFTKNGIGLPFAFIDYPFSEIPSMVPVVGLRSEGETIRGNFGGKSFEFDIECYYYNFQQSMLSRILLSGKLEFFKKKKKKQLFDQNVNLQEHFIEKNIIDFLKKIKMKKMPNIDTSDFRLKKFPVTIYLDVLLNKSFFKNIHKTFKNLKIWNQKSIHFAQINTSFFFKNIRNLFFKHFLTYFLNFLKKNKSLTDFREYLLKFIKNRQELCEISENSPYNLIFWGPDVTTPDISTFLIILKNCKFSYVKHLSCIPGVNPF